MILPTAPVAPTTATDSNTNLLSPQAGFLSSRSRAEYPRPQGDSPVDGYVSRPPLRRRANPKL